MESNITTSRRNETTKRSIIWPCKPSWGPAGPERRYSRSKSDDTGREKWTTCLASANSGRFSATILHHLTAVWESKATQSRGLREYFAATHMTRLEHGFAAATIGSPLAGLLAGCCCWFSCERGVSRCLTNLLLQWSQRYCHFETHSLCRIWAPQRRRYTVQAFFKTNMGRIHSGMGEMWLRSTATAA